MESFLSRSCLLLNVETPSSMGGVDDWGETYLDEGVRSKGRDAVAIALG